jgi:hypothetical protein
MLNKRESTFAVRMDARSLSALASGSQRATPPPVTKSIRLTLSQAAPWRKWAAAVASLRILRLRLVALSLAALTATSLAQAGTIAVTTTAMGDNVTGCGLTEAITALNTMTSYHGCTVVDGSSQKITLPAGTFTTWEDMTVYYDVEIVGAGMGSTVINSGGHWVFGSYANFFTLRNLTVQRRTDQSLLVSGVVKVSGVLTLDQVKVTRCTDKAIDIDQADAVITNSRVESNTVGIWSECSNVNISNTTVSSNSNGGIATDLDGTCVKQLTVTNSTIENNSCLGPGGGIANNLGGTSSVNANMKIQNSTIFNNAAPYGGGIADFGHSSIYNSTITNNKATSGPGGGIYRNSQGEFTIAYTTVSHNSATNQGGGVFTTGSSFYPYSNIFANNTAGSDLDFSGFVTSGTGDYNLIKNKGSSTGWCTPTGWPASCGGPGHAIVGVDPLLGSLQSLGGPTKVRPLSSGSPAIDANPNPVTVGQLTTDQRGISRPRDGNSDGVARYDLGAYEK